MTNGRDLDRIVSAAREHYKNLTADIYNAKDRQEHIRLTALAQEAHNLLLELISFSTGLVYSHTALHAVKQVAENGSYAIVDDQMQTQETLDLPEFESPYKPSTE